MNPFLHLTEGSPWQIIHLQPSSELPLRLLSTRHEATIGTKCDHISGEGCHDIGSSKSSERLLLGGL